MIANTSIVSHNYFSFGWEQLRSSLFTTLKFALCCCLGLLCWALPLSACSPTLLALGEASCHVERTFKKPHEDLHIVRNQPVCTTLPAMWVTYHGSVSSTFPTSGLPEEAPDIMECHGCRSSSHYVCIPASRKEKRMKRGAHNLYFRTLSGNCIWHFCSFPIGHNIVSRSYLATREAGVYRLCLNSCISRMIIEGFRVHTPTSFSRN